MQEVSVRLKFTQPCLGAVPRTIGQHRLFKMHRTPEGQVMFLPTWWNSIVRDAAVQLNKPVRLVRQIRWAAAIDGVPVRWPRYLPDTERRKHRPFAMHEAFLPGTEIVVGATLPDGLSIADLTGLLELAGALYGISPYKPRQYGQFEVVSIKPLGVA